MVETTQSEAPAGAFQILYVNHELVSVKALLKTCYWFSRDFFCGVSHSEPGQSTVELKPKPTCVTSPEEAKDQFMAQAMDFALRERITAKTSEVRDLLLAKAFSESGVFEETPQGVVGDRVEEENPSGMFKILSNA